MAANIVKKPRIVQKAGRIKPTLQPMKNGTRMRNRITIVEKAPPVKKVSRQGIVMGQMVNITTDIEAQRYDLRVDGRLISSDVNLAVIERQSQAMGVEWNDEQPESAAA